MGAGVEVANGLMNFGLAATGGGLGLVAGGGGFEEGAVTGAGAPGVGVACLDGESGPLT